MKLCWIPLSEWATREQAERVRAVWAQPRLVIVVQALRKLNISPLLVGGFVRDLVLHRDNKDLDFVVDCSAEVLMKNRFRLAQETSATQVPLDEVRGTLRLCFKDREEIDLVARQGDSLLDDLSRRDLRMNAMALDSQGRLADPAHGLHDLRNKVIAMVGAENFLADPLRVVRCLRFAAQLNFPLDEETAEQAKKAQRQLGEIAGERILAELKIFFSYARKPQIELLENFGLREELFSDLRCSSLELLRSAVPVKDWRIGLALWLGPKVEGQKFRARVYSRLRLSKKTRLFLQGFWNGVAWYRKAENAEPEDVFHLFKQSGPAFTSIADLALNEVLVSPLAGAQRRQIWRESQGKGSINWEPVPWTGGQVSELAGRTPGPWLGPVMGRLEIAWACHGLKELTDCLTLIEKNP